MDLNFNSVLALILALLLIAFVISMLVNVATNPKFDNTIKIIWCLGMLFIPILAIIYYGYIYDGKFAVKNRINKSLGLK